MNIEQALTAYLKAHAALAALIGGRVYPQRLPQDPVLPAVTYTVISDPREHTHAGPAGLAHPRVQLDAWAGTTSQAREVARELRRALDGYRGVMGPAPGVRVDKALVVGGLDDYEEATGRARRSIDVMLSHAE